MKPIERTVYLQANAKDCDYIVSGYDYSYENDVKKERGYFFTDVELNEYIERVIRVTLENAADGAKTKEDIAIFTEGTFKTSVVDIDSIMDTFDKTFEKLKYDNDSNF